MLVRIPEGIQSRFNGISHATHAPPGLNGSPVIGPRQGGGNPGDSPGLGLNRTHHKWLVKTGRTQLSLISVGSAVACEGLISFEIYCLQHHKVIFFLAHTSKSPS